MASSQKTPRFYFCCVGQSILNSSSPLYGKYQNARIETFDKEGRQDGFASWEFDFTAPNEIYWEIYDFFNNLMIDNLLRIKYENGKFSILEIPNILISVKIGDKYKQKSFTSEEAKSKLEEIVRGHEDFKHFRINFDMQEMFDEKINLK